MDTQKPPTASPASLDQSKLNETRQPSQTRTDRVDHLLAGRTLYFVLPTLNEEAGIGWTIREIHRVFRGVSHEVIIVDGNSRDRTVEIATGLGARHLPEPGPADQRGYGNALNAGFRHVVHELATSDDDVVVMLDADTTYLPRDVPSMLRELHAAGAGMVIGNRFANMAEGAMTVRNRAGNKVITLFLNLLYQMHVKDSQCGMRAMTVGALRRMRLLQNGMPFATEMLMEARKRKIPYAQVPITYETRAGEAKLSPILDGSRIVLAMIDHFTGYRKTKFFHFLEDRLPALIAPFDWVLRKFTTG